MQINKINIFLILLIQFSLYSSQDQIDVGEGNSISTEKEKTENKLDNILDPFIPIRDLRKIISDYTQGWQSYKSIEDKENSNIGSFSISPDGKYFASGYYNGKVKIWSAETGNVEKEFNEGDSRVSVTFSQPDGKYLAVSDYASITKIFDYKSGKEIQRLYVTGPTYSQSGKYLAGIGTGNKIKIFDANDYSILNQFAAVGSEVYIKNLIFSPDNKYLAFSDLVRTYLLDFNVPELKKINVDSRSSIDISRNSKFLATGSVHQASVYDIETEKLVHKFFDTGELSNISVKFSPDNSFFAVAARSILKIWDFKTKNLLKEISEEDGTIKFINFLPNNNLVYVLDLFKGNKVIKIWQL